MELLNTEKAETYFTIKFTGSELVAITESIGKGYGNYSLYKGLRDLCEKEGLK